MAFSDRLSGDYAGKNFELSADLSFHEEVAFAQIRSKNPVHSISNI
jgi:hypothetical protein